MVLEMNSLLSSAPECASSSSYYVLAATLLLHTGKFIFVDMAHLAHKSQNCATINNASNRLVQIYRRHGAPLPMRNFNAQRERALSSEPADYEKNATFPTDTDDIHFKGGLG